MSLSPIPKEEPRYISFEGTDGCGKTTQARRFVEWLQQHEIPVRMTREPGGTPLGEEIRRLVMFENAERAPVPVTELLLYLADRAQHLEQVVRPALRQGLWVVSDRALDSTLVYQGLARGFGLDLVVRLHRLLGLWQPPDVTFILDLPPRLSLARKASSGVAQWSRFEREILAFHERVYAGYRELLQRFPERCLRIDARGSIDEVHAAVVEAFQQWLAKQSGSARAT